MLHLCPFRMEKGVNKQSKIHFHVAGAVFLFFHGCTRGFGIKNICYDKLRFDLE